MDVAAGMLHGRCRELGALGEYPQPSYCMGVFAKSCAVTTTTNETRLEERVPPRTLPQRFGPWPDVINICFEADYSFSAPHNPCVTRHRLQRFHVSSVRLARRHTACSRRRQRNGGTWPRSARTYAQTALSDSGASSTPGIGVHPLFMQRGASRIWIANLDSNRLHNFEIAAFNTKGPTPTTNPTKNPTSSSVGRGPRICIAHCVRQGVQLSC